MSWAQWKREWLFGPDGLVDYDRVRSLSALIGFFMGVLIMMVAALIRLVWPDAKVENEMIYLAAGVLVTPLTGGRITSFIMNRGHSKKFLRGEAPDRRSARNRAPEIQGQEDWITPRSQPGSAKARDEE